MTATAISRRNLVGGGVAMLGLTACGRKDHRHTVATAKGPVAVPVSPRRVVAASPSVASHMWDVGFDPVGAYELEPLTILTARASRTPSPASPRSCSNPSSPSRCGRAVRRPRIWRITSPRPRSCPAGNWPIACRRPTRSSPNPLTVAPVRQVFERPGFKQLEAVRNGHVLHVQPTYLPAGQVIGNLRLLETFLKKING